MTADSPAPPPAVSRTAFRDVIGRFATGVTVITSRDGHGDHGLTASAVSSLSMDPPMLLACINRSSRTGDAIRASGQFTVNVLAEDQVTVAHRFASPTSEDKFSGVDTSRGPLGTLVLEGALARIDCLVDTDVVAATHRIFLGAVVGVEGRDVPPLAYFRGQFGQLHLPRDEADPPEVAEAIDARTGIELGAVELGIGRASATVVTELRRLAQQTLTILSRAQAHDEAGGAPDEEGVAPDEEGVAPDEGGVAAYRANNTAFHEALVRLAGVPALLDAHRRLALPGIMRRGGTDLTEIHVGHGEDHVAIATAVEAGDAAAARAAIRRHADRTMAARAGDVGAAADD